MNQLSIKSEDDIILGGWILIKALYISVFKIRIV